MVSADSYLMANRVLRMILPERLLHRHGRFMISLPDQAWTTSLGTRITRPQAGAAGEAWGCLTGA